MKKYVCIDIGGTSIKYGLAHSDGTFLAKADLPTLAKKEGGAGILVKTKDIVKVYADQEKISGVCISTAGMVDPKAGKIVYAAEHLIPHYTGMELKREIEQEFSVRCEVENDVNCAGLGEMWLGAGAGANSLFCLTVGTGIGGCLILDRCLVRGCCNSAGEIGYMEVRGHPFQDLAATSRLVECVAERKRGKEGEIDGKQVFVLAAQGDPDCVGAIDEMVECLAVGIASVCYVVNPQLVILGGGIMAQEAYLRPRIDLALKKNLIDRIYRHTKVAFAARQNDAGMLGALYNFLK